MFSEEFLAKLDPSYRNILLKLLEKVESDNDDYDEEEKEKMLINFSKKYMLPIELWSELYEEYCYDENPAFAYYQFYFPDEAAMDLELDNVHKLMNLKAVFEDRRWEQLPRLIEFPNFDMDNFLMESEESVDKPIAKTSLQKYAKTRPLYDKILSVKDNSEAWFKALTETEDVEFVKHNVEYRLGGDLSDKVLWKLYINYLEKFDVEAMLHTYSKYCRFFLDDKEMKEKYKKALEKNGEFEVPWKNVFSTEKFNRKTPKKCIQKLKQNGRKPIFPTKNCDETRKRKIITPHFSSKNLQQQNFAFNEPLISYILKYSNCCVGEKLYKSCKYFYANFPHPFCYKLCIKHNSSVKSAKEVLQEESIYVEFKEFPENLELFNNLRISTIFSFENVEKSEKDCVDEYLLSKLIIPRISQCNARYVLLNSKQILTFNELKFFIGHGNVIKLELIGIKCFDESGKGVVIEEILKLTPKIMHFVVKNPSFSQQSAQILAIIPFKNKFCCFSFFTEKNEFEPYAFAEFITKNASQNCEIKYCENINLSNFDEILQKAIDEKWKCKHKPSITKVPFTHEN